MALYIPLSLMTSGAYAIEYKDVEGHWAAEAIDRWSGYGVIEGDDGGFHPDDGMSRAEAAIVFVRLLGLNSAEGAMAFFDTKGHWAEDAFAKVSAAGIMDGVSDGKADPEGRITREQFFVMFARALGLKEQAATSGPASDGGDWSAGFINALTDRGYVRGDGNGVNASSIINRASMISLLNQTISTYANEDGATVTGAGNGVILVVADNVTVTGNVADLVVAEGANSVGAAAVTLENVTVTGQVILTAGAGISIVGDSSVSEIIMTVAASGASVSVGEGAVVRRIETSAKDSTVSVRGEVSAIVATETASGTEIELSKGAKIGDVDAAALGDNITIRDASVAPPAAGSTGNIDHSDGRHIESGTVSDNHGNVVNSDRDNTDGNGGGDDDDDQPGGDTGDGEPGGGTGDDVPGDNTEDDVPDDGTGDDTPSGGTEDDNPSGGTEDDTPGGGTENDNPGGGTENDTPGGGTEDDNLDDGTGGDLPGGNDATPDAALEEALTEIGVSATVDPNGNGKKRITANIAADADAVRDTVMAVYETLEEKILAVHFADVLDRLMNPDEGIDFPNDLFEDGEDIEESWEFLDFFDVLIQNITDENIIGILAALESLSIVIEENNSRITYSFIFPTYTA